MTASQQAANAEQQSAIAVETALGAAAYAPLLAVSNTAAVRTYFFMIISTGFRTFYFAAGDQKVTRILRLSTSAATAARARP